MSNGFTNSGPMTEVFAEQDRQFRLMVAELFMVAELSNVYDVYGILEILAMLAPQGVPFDQVQASLIALQPKAA